MKNAPKAADIIANAKRPELHSEMVLLSRQETGVYGNVYSSWKKTKSGTWTPPSSNVLVPTTATTTTTTVISRTTPTSSMVLSNHQKTSENNVPGGEIKPKSAQTANFELRLISPLCSF